MAAVSQSALRTYHSRQQKGSQAHAEGIRFLVEPHWIYDFLQIGVTGPFGLIRQGLNAKPPDLLTFWNGEDVAYATSQETLSQSLQNADTVGNQIPVVGVNERASFMFT